MHRLKSLLGRDQASRRPAQTDSSLIAEAKPIDRNAGNGKPSTHDEWLFGAERPALTVKDLIAKLASLLERVRACLSRIADHAPIVSETPCGRVQVEFSAHSDLDDEDLFGDEPASARRPSATPADPALFDDKSFGRHANA